MPLLQENEWVIFLLPEKINQGSNVFFKDTNTNSNKDTNTNSNKDTNLLENRLREFAETIPTETTIEEFLRNLTNLEFGVLREKVRNLKEEKTEGAIETLRKERLDKLSELRKGFEIAREKLRKREIYGYGIRMTHEPSQNVFKKKITIKKIIGFIKPEQPANIIYAIFNDFNYSYLPCLVCHNSHSNYGNLGCNEYVEHKTKKPLLYRSLLYEQFDNFAKLKLAKSNAKSNRPEIKDNTANLIFTPHMFFNQFGLRPQKFFDKKYIPNHNSCNSSGPKMKGGNVPKNMPRNIIPLFGGNKYVYVINLDIVAGDNISFSVKVYYNKQAYNKYKDYIKNLNNLNIDNDMFKNMYLDSYSTIILDIENSNNLTNATNMNATNMNATYATNMNATDATNTIATTDMNVMNDSYA
jgi:hypothetical protein